MAETRKFERKTNGQEGRKDSLDFNYLKMMPELGKMVVQAAMRSFMVVVIVE